MRTQTAQGLGVRAGFWVVATAFLVAMAYSTVPTPLYALYQQRDGFPVPVLTLIFSAYAVGVVFSLFFAGHLSDVFGRRRMLLVAVLVSALAAALFVAFEGVPGLLAARFVDGASIGILTATATAHLGELRARALPAEPLIVAASIAGAANLGGLAIGPLIGGAFAEFLPAPLLLPHVVFLVLFVVLAIAVARVPETVTPPVPRPRYRPQRLAFPEASRGAFVAAGLGAFAAFALLSLFSALSPTFLERSFGDDDHLAAGALPFAVFASAAVAQIALARVALRAQLVVAIGCCAVGLPGIAFGAVLPQLAVFVVSGMVAGVGVGVMFRSAIATVSALAAPDRRGENLALLFLFAYCGAAIPAIALGISLEFVADVPAIVAFSGFVWLVTLGAGAVLLRRARRA